MRWLDGARARLRLLFARRSAESRMDREIQFHIEMETDRLVDAMGLSRAEARRRALAAFGGVEAHKESLRDGRGLAWLGGLSIDTKLAARTLGKYPGITFAGGLALAIGIGLGAAYLEVVSDVLRPTLPLDEGERIVGLQNWDVEANDPEPRSLHDFATWRAALASVQDVGAFRAIERNVGTEDRPAEPAAGAEITPSAFRMARVPALLGRTLTDEDERDGSAPVVVLGYHLWKNRFSGDPAIVGQPVLLGDARSTVAGVMPEGFAFPVNQQFWVPLRANPAAYGRRQGPAIQVFGRLAPGVSLAEAQAELATLGARAAADFPSTHAHLRPRVLRYTELFAGGEDGATAYYVQVLFVLLLLVLSSNVATMIFARTASREHEIAMRLALGSSRARILMQFFVEALVLALAAAAVGLAVVSSGADWVTRLVWDITDGRIPFWLEAGGRLNATTILYAAGVAVLGSLVAGVLPAVKATQSRLQTALRLSATGGGTTLRFGGLWSALIVVQVAFAVMVLPPAIVAISGLAAGDHADPGFAAHEYLSARLEMDGSYEQFRTACDELRRRLLDAPGISRVTLASRLAGMNHPEPDVEVEAAAGAPAIGPETVMAAAVGVEYFDAFGAAIVAGRGFTSGDARPGASAVIVNEHFANEVLQGRNAVGRRIRYSTRYGDWYATGQEFEQPRAVMLQPGPWYEIVGVVRNLGMDTTKDAFTSGEGPGIYHALTPGAMGSAGAYSVRIAFHVRGDAAAFAPRVRDIAHGVSPALRLYDVVPMDRPLDRVSQVQRRVARFMAAMTALVAAIALLICIAGIYSLLSFTVARQTREIGIRIALGADRRHIVAGVFSRAMIQMATGIAIGALIWIYVIVVLLGGGNRIELLVTTAAAVMGVGAIACGVPVRRALRIEPTEALRHDG